MDTSRSPYCFIFLINILLLSSEISMHILSGSLILSQGIHGDAECSSFPVQTQESTA